MSWLKRLTSGLSKSSNKISEGISSIVTKRKLDDAMLEELEELLIMADMGAATAARIVGNIAKKRFEKEVDPGEVKRALAEEIAEILAPVAQALTPLQSNKPHTIVMVGVNGNGKTTTVGKIAHQLRGEGKNVTIAACDTFRAAAVEQLAEWGERAKCQVFTGEPNADPASVAYQALESAKAQNSDVLLIDTAGRLQNKSHLMDELGKVTRVLSKLDDTAPHDTILVLDATTGQNAHSQVQLFKEHANITGLIVTKLDGTAKGGVVVALADQYKLPIVAVGVGETIEDLQPFSPSEYAESLVGI